MGNRRSRVSLEVAMKVQDQAAFEKRQAHAGRIIKLGLVFLCIGSVLLLLDATAQLIETIVYPFTGEVKWNDFVSVFQYVMKPFLFFVLTFAAIGGFSYAKGKGPFISFVSLMAIVMFVIFFVDLALSIVTLTQDHDWANFFLGLLSLQLDTGFYAIGWALAKDDFN